MLNIFDSYERNARVYPAIIVSLPLIITCYSISSLFKGSFTIKLSINSPIILATLVLLSNIVRHYGKETESKIWKDWGGAPSTRFLRKDDTYFASATKQKIYQKILREENINLDADNSDEKINQAFRVICNRLRLQKNKGLWQKFNMEYGFNRNLLGSRKIWLILSILSSATCFAVNFYLGNNSNFLIILGGFVNLGIVCVSILCGWIIIPKLIKGIAERYAEEVILSYLRLS